MAAPDQLDELRHRFAAQPRRYFAPLANALRQAGAYEEAVTMLRAQLAELPDHLTGHVVLGQALFDTGALADARDAFETARALDPGNRVVLRQLGEIASLGGDQTAARLWFGRLRAADPYADDVEAQLGGTGAEPPYADERDVGGDGPRVARTDEVAERAPAALDRTPQGEATHAGASGDAAGRDDVPGDAIGDVPRDDGTTATVDASAFELLEFDPVVAAPAVFESAEPGGPALDPVVGLDLAPPEAGRPDDAASDILAAAEPDDAAPEPAPRLEHIASGPFATETMAGLLAAQGHTDQAVALYERLTAERPGDAALRARLDALRASPVIETAMTASAPAEAQVAGLRPGESDAERGALLATAFATMPVPGDAAPDPYADLSFDRFFVAGDLSDAARPDDAPAALPELPSVAVETADPDADLARFDAWLREVAT